MQSYEKLHKLVIEYVSIKAGLERALSSDSAADEVSFTPMQLIDSIAVISLLPYVDM